MVWVGPGLLPWVLWLPRRGHGLEPQLLMGDSPQLIREGCPPRRGPVPIWGLEFLTAELCKLVCKVKSPQILLPVLGGGAGVAKIRRNSKKGSHGFLGKGEAAMGSQQALCWPCSLLPPPWAPARCSWMAPLCSPHGRCGGWGLPSLTFARRLAFTAHQPGPSPSWLESLLRVVVEDSRGWHVCSYPREEG